MPAIACAQADLILYNGKIVTVDDRFTIAQAIAIKGERIIGVGSNAAMLKLADANTKKIDIKGRTVIPGLIDNHAHIARGSQHWGIEVRWDGITSRKQALAKLGHSIAVDGKYGSSTQKPSSTARWIVPIRLEPDHP